MFGFLKKLFNKEETEPDPMKYLIVGLGNPGSKYDGTRHNVGFEIIDALADEHEVEFEDVTHGFMGEFKFKGRTFVLLKPTTYMNLSGKAVRYWMQKKKITKENILIVLDDLNIDFGRMKIRGKGSDGGHNGLKHINEILGHNNYTRLRIGIGDDFKKGRQVNFVLGEWSEDELAGLHDIRDRASACIKMFATAGLSHAMNEYNKKG